jgi:hypothetical protein
MWVQLTAARLEKMWDKKSALPWVLPKVLVSVVPLAHELEKVLELQWAAEKGDKSVQVKVRGLVVESTWVPVLGDAMQWEEM